MLSMRRTTPHAGAPTTATPDATPVGGSLLAGLVASVCCGGSLVFASIGLGALYGSLGLWRFIPQALALGALSIVAINYWYYRRRAKQLLAADPACDCGGLRRAMVLSGVLGLLMMAGSFVLLEWLNHAIVNPGRFMSQPQYAQALIPGVTNQSLLYVALTFLAVPALALLPLPGDARRANTAGA